MSIRIRLLALIAALCVALTAVAQTDALVATPAGKLRGVRVTTIYGGRAYEPQLDALGGGRRIFNHENMHVQPNPS